VQNHVALNRMRGRSARMPLMVMRCTATFPASIVPAAIIVSWLAIASSPLASTESRGSPIASATSRSDGPKLARR